MKSDPIQRQFQETVWRRPLTASERAELQAWLTAHPERQSDVATENLLSELLTQRAPATVSSNFTARVLRAIESEKHSVHINPVSWWRRFLPRMAVVGGVLLVSLIGYRQHLIGKQRELARAAHEVANVRSLTDPVVIEDFEIIRQLPPFAVVADEKLLALSDELLALHP
ncbi:MAG: hypothetical protein M9920_08575 [Verrucomicrobiae bacterium]|nr:hypothetical protein [Verrucomicrobiae bacterium]